MDFLRKTLSRGYEVYKTLRSFSSNQEAALENLDQGLTDQNSSNQSKQNEKNIERILSAYHKAKAYQLSLPAAYQPGVEWENDLKTRRMLYVKALQDKNVGALNGFFSNFFRNECAGGLIAYSYFFEIMKGSNLYKKSFINAILKDLDQWKNLVGGNTQDLATPFVGNPWGYLLDGKLITSVSCIHHYYANTISNILTDTESPTVLEIGGGFGGLAYYLLKSSPKMTYLGVDLPEMSAVAQYYLLNTFPDKKILLFGEIESSGITPNLIQDYDIILMPNFQLPQISDYAADLVVNTRSLSEMSWPTVQEYISQITRICKSYFFHDNSDQAVVKGGGHIEVSASHFPIPKDRFKRIYKAQSIWGMGGGRYWEHLYQVRVGIDQRKMKGDS